MDRLGGMLRTFSVLTLFFILVTFLVLPTSSLKCYQCGQYNDGVGSITPCINHTERLHLKECPLSTSHQCIKYVSEGSTVRDCSPGDCTERGESWGTKVFCCSEDGCNSADKVQGETLPVVMVATLLAATINMAAN